MNNSILKNKKIFLLIAIAYAFSVFCRLEWVWWASGFDEFIYNDNLIINSHDGYAFAEGARDMLAGFHQEGDLSYYGSPLSTLAFLIVKFSPFSLESVMLYLSAALSSLIVVPLILIGKNLNALRAGFCSALIACIANSYYNRTMVGYFDTDMLNIVLACFIIWGLVRLNIYKDIFSALIASFSMLIYAWWYPSSFTLNIATISVFLLYTLIFARNEKINYLTMILMLLAITSIDLWLKISLFIIILLLYKSKFYQLSNRQNAIIIALGIAIFSLFIFSGGLNPIWFQLKFYILRSVPEKDTLNFIFFNVNQTIQESSIIPFSIFSERISSSLVVFLLSCFGYILAVFRHKILLLSLPMCALGFLALFSGLRFTIYAVPFMAFGFGFLLEILCHMLNNRIKHKKPFWYAFILISFVPALYFWYLQEQIGQFVWEFWLYLALFLLAFLWVFFRKDLGAQMIFAACMLALMPSFLHIYTYKIKSVFFKDEVSVLENFKNIAGREDYALSWWDYGYIIRFYSDVKTLIDGGKHLGSDNFAVSFALTKAQTSSANIARLEVEYTQKNLYENFGLNLAKIMKDYNASDVNEFLLSLDDKNFTLPKKTRDIYFVLLDRMHYIIPTISRFSDIDLKTGRSYESGLFMINEGLKKSERGIELGGGAYLDKSFLNINGQKLPINTFIDTEYKNGKLSLEYFKFDERSRIFVIYMSDYNRLLILDKSMFESAFIQLFVLENYDKDLFEPVILTPKIKIYKLKV